MGQSSKKNGQFSIFGRLSPDAAARVADYLQRRHPDKTAAWVEAETGIPAHRVRKWIDRASAPSGLAMLALIGAYGPEFLAKVFDQPPLWVSEAAMTARRDSVQARVSALQEELQCFS